MKEITMKNLALTAFLLAFTSWPALGAWTPFGCGPTHAQSLADHRAALESKPSEDFPILRVYPNTTGQVLEDLKDQLARFESTQERTSLVGSTIENEDVLGLWSSGSLDFEVVPVENWSLSRCSTWSDLTMVYSIRAYVRDAQRDVLRAAIGRDGLLVTWKILPKPTATKRPTVPFPDPSKTRDRVRRIFRVVPGPAEYVWLDARGFDCSELFPCLATSVHAGTIAIETHDGEILSLDSTSPHHKVRTAREKGPSAMEIPGRYVITLGPGTVVELHRATPPAE